MSNQYKDEQLKEIFNNEIRNMIVRLLMIKEELSLTQLSKIMNMNKTTIQYHLKILRDKDIIFESRESHQDSRGSIPTKYYQLKHKILGYRVSFNDIKDITNHKEKLLAYKEYLQSLKAGLIDIRNIILYAEEAIENKLLMVEKYESMKLSNKLLEGLHEEISEIRTSFSSFSTTKNTFSKIREEIPNIYKKFEKMQIDEDKESDEGYEVITLSIPLVELLESRITNKKRK